MLYKAYLSYSRIGFFAAIFLTFVTPILSIVIPKETIDLIFETARIEDVVGDYVSLKKKGANLWGLCPFHNEKTPSFSVAPAKGIYKCFGCGKGGNSVNFLMEHEQYTYPEALRALAKRYNIEIHEEEQTAEDIAEQNERESLYIVSTFAEEFFIDNLHNTEEGKSIALSYFKERGFTDETIKKFHLGYSPEKRTAFADAAKEKGYQKQYLEKAGLVIDKESYVFDRFASRVMFPIHNLSGRVIAFGGRTLRTDKKIAKYINSPETDIYHKSKVLYGIYQAKKTIVEKDNCYLVEGYTDVISFAQAGIENVVASSGTSLTVEQIRLVKRYTPNITILYDGDAAGIKASFRGIDLVLEEGMNVKVVLFPEGEDPDSYSKKLDSDELKEFIESHAQDFITFKTNLLLEDVKSDPVKKAGLIKDIVESISLIPDRITRSLYIQECSNLMDIDEQVLIAELNKLRRKNFRDKAKEAGHTQNEVDIPESTITSPTQQDVAKDNFTDIEFQEKDVIRILLTYGSQNIELPAFTEDGEDELVPVNIAQFIHSELGADGIRFENEIYQKVFEEYTEFLSRMEIPDEKHFINHEDQEISTLAVNLFSEPYDLSKNWEVHMIYVTHEQSDLKKTVFKAIYSLKLKKLMQLIMLTQEKLKTIDSEEDLMALLEQQKLLMEAKRQISTELGRVVLK